MKKAGLRPAFLLMSHDEIANSNKRDISLSRFPFLTLLFLYYLARALLPCSSLFSLITLLFLLSLLFLLFPYYLALTLSPFSSLFSLLFPIFPYQKSIAYYALQPSFHTSSSQTPVSTFLRPFQES